MQRDTDTQVDRAYREGFYAAIMSVMFDCRASHEQVENTRYLNKLAGWKIGPSEKTKIGVTIHPRMSRDEARQFVSYINSGFWDDQGDISDA